MYAETHVLKINKYLLVHVYFSKDSIINTNVINLEVKNTVKREVILIGLKFKSVLVVYVNTNDLV